jgi:hypothetical protein
MIPKKYPSNYWSDIRFERFTKNQSQQTLAVGKCVSWLRKGAHEDKW